GIIHKDSGVYGYSNSYAHAVKIWHGSQNVEEENKPTIVLDGTCVNQQDYSTSLMDDEEESDTDDEIRDEELYDESESMNNHATVEGESDVKEVSKTIFDNEQYQAHKKDDLNVGQNDICLEDPFNIYDLLNKKQDNNIRGDECLQNIHDEKVASEAKKTCPLSNPKEGSEGSICSGHLKKPNYHGLEELPLCGYSFIWCYKSATKMSKLDCSLISEDSNAMTKLMKKTKYLKEKIRAWIKVKKGSLKTYKKTLKAELAEIELLLDKGEGNSDVLNKLLSVSKSVPELDKLESMEVAQKAKLNGRLKEMRIQNTIMVKYKYVTRNTGKGQKNEENADSYETLWCNPYDSVTP
nr:RNA-directed DNA polymerase, eukaryota, reverse transcriptase zinc-binding domain protein [Tanacetum cinerariifolium]